MTSEQASEIQQFAEMIKRLEKDAEALLVRDEKEFETAKICSQICTEMNSQARAFLDTLDAANKKICAKMDKYTRSMFGTGKKETNMPGAKAANTIPQKQANPPAPPAPPSMSLDDFDEAPIDPMDDLALEIGKSTNKTLF
jgi:hypothetical protein